MEEIRFNPHTGLVIYPFNRNIPTSTIKGYKIIIVISNSCYCCGLFHKRTQMFQINGSNAVVCSECVDGINYIFGDEDSIFICPNGYTFIKGDLTIYKAINIKSELRYIVMQKRGNALRLEAVRINNVNTDYNYYANIFYDELYCIFKIFTTQFVEGLSDEMFKLYLSII
jgi:hypothetical protein